jgi:hypothetical protein
VTEHSARGRPENQQPDTFRSALSSRSLRGAVPRKSSATLEIEEGTYRIAKLEHKRTFLPPLLSQFDSEHCQRLSRVALSAGAVMTDVDFDRSDVPRSPLATRLSDYDENQIKIENEY